MTSTATQIIDAALMSLGVLEDDDTVADTGSTDAQRWGTRALRSLNNVLALCSAQPEMIMGYTRKAITVNDAGYEFTMTERPHHVESISYKTDGGQDLFLDRMSVQEFEAIANKGNTAWPTKFLYNPTYQYGTMFFNSTIAAGAQFTIVYYAPLSSIAALTDDVSLPDEYVPYLESHVAVMEAPKFRVAVPAGVKLIYDTTEEIITTRAMAAREAYAQVDPALTRRRGRYNVLTDR